MAQRDPRYFVNVLFAADVCSQLELKWRKRRKVASNHQFANLQWQIKYEH